MAGLYPDSDICAIDLWEMQSESDLLNFFPLSPVDFTDDDWSYEDESFDYIHLAQLCGSVPDWQHLFQTVFRYVASHRE